MSIKKNNALSTEDYFKWLETASPESLNRYNEYSSWLKELNKPPTLKQKVYKTIVNICKLFKIIFDGPLGFILSKITIAVLITLLFCGYFAGFAAICLIIMFNPYIGFILLLLFISIFLGLLLESF